MNFNDFLIIYLACGAPFGVYYFFDKRKLVTTKQLLLFSLLTFIFWVPFAVLLVAKKKTFRNNLEVFTDDFENSSFLDVEIEKKLFSIQKHFEKILLQSNLTISIYEFREIAERYIGLTFAKQNAENSTKSVNNENEIFIISDSSNPEISSICLNRRNRSRLSYHQKNARRDFFDVLSKFLSSETDKKNLGILSIEFVTLLADSEAKNMLLEMFDELPQSDQISIVKNPENELWKTETHKPLPAKQLSIQLQTLTATANLRRKD